VDHHGFDAGKLIKGKKRHILVDMQGLLLHAIVHSAGVQDRDGGIWLLATLVGQFPFLAKLFADSAYAGSIFHTALAKALPNLEMKSSDAPITPKGSCRYPSVGSSNVRSLG
jgi:putative transposase